MRLPDAQAGRGEAAQSPQRPIRRAKFWMAVLTDLSNRGIKDTFFVVCDGLKGLPEVVATCGRRS